MHASFTQPKFWKANLIHKPKKIKVWDFSVKSKINVHICGSFGVKKFQKIDFEKNCLHNSTVLMFYFLNTRPVRNYDARIEALTISLVHAKYAGNGWVKREREIRRKKSSNNA